MNVTHTVHATIYQFQYAATFNNLDKLSRYFGALSTINHHFFLARIIVAGNTK